MHARVLINVKAMIKAEFDPRCIAHTSAGMLLLTFRFYRPRQDPISGHLQTVALCQLKAVFFPMKHFLRSDAVSTCSCHVDLLAFETLHNENAILLLCKRFL